MSHSTPLDPEHGMTDAERVEFWMEQETALLSGEPLSEDQQRFLRIWAALHCHTAWVHYQTKVEAAKR